MFDSADPPSAIRVVNSDSEVRLGSETFSLDVEMIDRFENPCKNVEANVALSCANKALQVVAPITTITTNESGRFLLSAIQFSPCSVKRDVIGSQHINLLVNNELKQKVNVTIKSGNAVVSNLCKLLSYKFSFYRPSRCPEVVRAFECGRTQLREREPRRGSDGCVQLVGYRLGWRGLPRLCPVLKR